MATPLVADTTRHQARPALTVAQRVRAFLRVVQIDARRAHALLVVLVTPAVAVLFLSRFAVTEVVLWSDWSTNTARAFVVVGPVFAVWSAMLAQRDARPNRVDMLAATAVPRVRRELGQAAMGVMAAIASYSIVVACVLGYAAQRATWGGPDMLLVLFGAAVTALFALMGWLMGLVVPGRLTPIMAGMGTFLYTVASYTWGLQTSVLAALQPWRYLGNRWGASTTLFYDVSPYAGRPSPAGGALIALGAGSVLLAGYLYVRGTLRPALATLAVGALLLAPGWVLATEQEQPMRSPVAAPRPIANPAMTCAGQLVEVCLHQAYEVQLDDAVAFTEAFYAPLVGIAELPEVITQQLFREEPPFGTLPLNAGWTETPIEIVLVKEMGPALVGRDFEPLNMSQNAILTWLAEQAGERWFIGQAAEIDPVTADAGAWNAYATEVDVAAERFAALSPEEQRAWLEANWDALRSGELTLEDLP